MYVVVVRMAAVSTAETMLLGLAEHGYLGARQDDALMAAGRHSTPYPTSGYPVVRNYWLLPPLA